MRVKRLCVLLVLAALAAVAAPASAEQMTISANGSALTVDLDDNGAARALAAMLGEGDLSIEMVDYGDMEKYGSLPRSLPRSDEQITAVPGDVMLYQGSMIAIYYGTNSLAYTRIGRIAGATRESMLAALGAGDVTAKLSLK